MPEAVRNPGQGVQFMESERRSPLAFGASCGFKVVRTICKVFVEPQVAPIPQLVPHKGVLE